METKTLVLLAKKFSPAPEEINTNAAEFFDLDSLSLRDPRGMSPHPGSQSTHS